MKITIFLLSLILVSLSKPVYDLKKSYVINLTPLNYNDQVTKYRQNTNYVSVVQFYKYSGTNDLIFQMASHSHSQLTWINGRISLEEFLELVLLIVMNIPHYARKRESPNILHLKSSLQTLSPSSFSKYFYLHHRIN